MRLTEAAERVFARHETFHRLYRRGARKIFAERLEAVLGRCPDSDRFRPAGLIVRWT